MEHENAQAFLRTMEAVNEGLKIGHRSTFIDGTYEDGSAIPASISWMVACVHRAGLGGVLDCRAFRSVGRSQELGHLRILVF